MDLMIREMLDKDWNRVSKIYCDGIKTNLSTFEQDSPTYDEWNKSHLQKFRYVCLVKNNIVGWLALSPVSSRQAYSGVVELSIYIDEEFRNLKIGTKLIEHLINNLDNKEIWTIESLIIQENITSIKLHEKCGFRMVGYREKIAKDKYGIWRNTVLMERRITNEKVDFN